MGKNSLIQWCDSTVNPIMGCGGCELYPKPATILKEMDRVARERKIPGWNAGRARDLATVVIDDVWADLLASAEGPREGHVPEVTTTNLYHVRRRLAERIAAEHGVSGAFAEETIAAAVKCYAAKLHCNKGKNALNPGRNANPGYAPTFERITQFPGRLKEAAKWSDLTGQARDGEPWLDGLARLIFLSDMGDALSQAKDFPFLREEIKDTQTANGKRHLWLWLTKRPENMVKFAASIGGLPANFCAMTTVTSNETLSRVQALRKVKAHVRGLSIEPLWSPIAAKLDLTGIHWVIVGGESGSASNVQPFAVEWAEELRDKCRKEGVAFFVKQLGRMPTRGGRPIELNDKHGGDWSEWDKALRVRELPEYFRRYRQG